MALSVMGKMQRVMDHFDSRLNLERVQWKNEQQQANQTLVGQLVLTQQDANQMRSENVAL